MNNFQVCFQHFEIRTGPMQIICLGSLCLSVPVGLHLLLLLLVIPQLEQEDAAEEK